MKKKEENNKSAFIPEVIKTLAQLKEEKIAAKNKAESDAKEAKAHQEIMSEAREPMSDELWNRLNGIEGELNVEVLVYVPDSGWSLQNPHFDGVKYCAPVMQQPYNVFNFDGPSLWPKPPAPAESQEQQAPGDQQEPQPTGEGTEGATPEQVEALQEKTAQMNS